MRNESCKIQANKTLLIKSIIFFLIILAISVYDLYMHYTGKSMRSTSMYNNPIFLNIMLLVSICCIIMFFYLLIKIKFAFTFNEEGIIKYNTFSETMIPWYDIQSIKPVTSEVKNPLNKKPIISQAIFVYVKNPEKYISQARGLNKVFLQSIMKKYGTPIVLTTKLIKISFNELSDIVNEWFARYKNT
ncbi:MAG: STM3941 family protein [Neisseriaceae bacterium]